MLGAIAQPLGDNPAIGQGICRDFDENVSVPVSKLIGDFV
jgi:hypothetical protein